MEQDTVRRCGRCGEPAVVIVNRWGTWFGTSGRTDHVCQSCGAGFSLTAPLLPWFVVGTFAGVQLGGVGALAVVGSVVALLVNGPTEAVALLLVGGAGIGFGAGCLVYMAAPQVRAWRNPIVPGAKVPELRLGPPPDHRVCTCGATAPCVRLRARTILRFPAGTQGAYACQGCGREFTVPDVVSVTITAAMSLCLAGIAVFLATLLPFHDLRGDHFLVLGVLGLGVAAGLAVSTLGVAKGVRHPRR